MNHYDCIIIGGSYAGLSAALSLGRSLCNTLVIDNGNPANKQAERIHNLLGWDGMDPMRLLDAGMKELRNYEAVNFLNAEVTTASKENDIFKVSTSDGDTFTSRYVLLTTGMLPKLPELSGFEDCWAKTVLKCPYCHGYEFRNESTAVIGEGESAFNLAMLLRLWSQQILLFTHEGKLNNSMKKELEEAGIRIEAGRITSLVHKEGKLQAVVLEGNQSFIVSVLYYQPEMIMSGKLAESLGCKMNSSGGIETDVFQSTSVKGVYAAGDISSSGHSVAQAIASGSIAGIFISKAICGLAG